MARGGLDQLGRGPVPAPLGGEAYVELDRPHLLEQVDHGVAVAAQRQWAAGVVERQARTDAVPEVALGRGAEAGVRRRAAERVDVVTVRWVACTAVVSGPRTPASASTCVGVAPYAATQASFSATCSERWTCSGGPPPPRRWCASCRAGRHGRSGWRHRSRIPAHSARSATRLGPRVGAAVVVPHLHTLRRRAEAGAQVAGVEQRDPDARRRLAASIRARPIAFGSSYGVPSGWWWR